MAKILIHDAIFTARVVDLPENCPACGAVVAEAARFWDWHDTSTAGRLETDGGPDGMAVMSGDILHHSEGDEYLTGTVECYACGEPIIEAETVVKEGSGCAPRSIS